MHSSPLDVGFDVSDTACRAWRSAAWARAAALACCLSSSFLSASLRSMRSMEPSGLSRVCAQPSRLLPSGKVPVRGLCWCVPRGTDRPRPEVYNQPTKNRYANRKMW